MTADPLAAPERGAEVKPGPGFESLANYLRVLGNDKRLHVLQFLVQPHYIEEIASELRIARQSAQAHVDQLLEVGVIQRVRGRRESGPVTDYVIVPHRLFQIQESFTQLGRLETEWEEQPDVRAMTQPLVTGETSARDQAFPRLTIVHGMRIGQTSTLQGQGPWLIGREPNAQVCLDYDPFISTRHAEVRRGPEGGYELADLYSTNGTFVDWKRLGRGGTAALAQGSVVRVGKTLLVLRTPTL